MVCLFANFYSLVGFVIALALFFYSLFEAPCWSQLAKIIVMTACGVGGLLFLAGVLNRDFPPGLLQEFIELPWPLEAVKRTKLESKKEFFS